MAEVLANEHDFDGVEFVMSMIIGATMGMGAELAAAFMPWAAGLIRSMGKKVFGNATDDLANALERKAAERGGGAAAEGEAAAGGPKRTPNHRNTSTPNAATPNRLLKPTNQAQTRSPKRAAVLASLAATAVEAASPVGRRPSGGTPGMPRSRSSPRTVTW
ncbi:hypothetical protein ABZS66_00945 [Dactylosporangium sp. NPDC005572]|uniref:hypothetical protein n=1 Tax=Dactylosporangium sp. NPDC005572 TaxID=3156889 RepID=UPI0033A9D8AA